MLLRSTVGSSFQRVDFVVDRDEEGHAGSPTRLAPRTALCVAVCVIATGCAPQTVNQVTPPSPRQSDQQTAESPTGKPTWHYVVRLRDDSNQLSAQVCFDGFTPERLIPSIEGAQNLLRDAYIGQQRCAREDSAIIVDQPLVERCLRYTIDLDAAGTRGARDGALRVGADWILSPDVWMWIPEPRPEGVLPEVQFDLPAGVDVAVPWRPTGRQRFAVPESHFVWKSQGAVGRFHRQRHEVGGGALDVVLLGEWAHPSDVVQLVLRAAKTTTQVWGRLPSRRAQVLLVPRAKWRQPFGFALRGGGDSITLLLPHDFTTADIARDWAAVHELLHLGLPAMPIADAWLFEGFTTYFTAIARARSGWISERAGWWELLDGFKRGTAAGTGRSLAAESVDMHATHDYWRVYWAGAAIALEIDVLLRRDHGTALDLALHQLLSRELDPAKRWTAAEILQQLDDITGNNAASRVASRELVRHEFPDVQSVLGVLGVRLDDRPCLDKPCEAHVRYDDDAPQAGVRRQLMRGAAGTTAGTSP